MATLPTAWSLILPQTRIEVKQFFRQGAAVIFIFAYPILMLAIFASVYGSADVTLPDGSAVPFAQFFLPGMIATGLMLTSFQSTATWIAGERDDGTLKRIRATPAPPIAYFAGKIGMVLITSIAQTALLLLLGALVFDVALPAEASVWVTFTWTFVLSVATGTVLGIAYSSLIRSGRSATALVLPPVLVLQFISGVFFEFSSLPSWMQTLAAIFPLKWMAQSMRSVFLPHAAEALEVGGSWQHGWTAVVLLAWFVVGLALTLRTFRWYQKR